MMRILANVVTDQAPMTTCPWHLLGILFSLLTWV